ncbi:MAG: putative LPS assembly protein LptD [Vicinamibacterales bacterium]|nr:putative LPS assembly protein LptD [Vicinamibacterales bacterium]
MRFSRVLVVTCALAIGIAANARAQQPPGAGVPENTFSETRELISNREYHFGGKAEIVLGDTRVFADDVRWFNDTNMATLTGNVVFAQGNNRIAADRAEFNTSTKIGTFYNAFGTANVQPPLNSRPGVIAAPPVVGRETDVYFYGDTIEKLGPRKYRITNGGFTTCVQPTPRWQLSSSTLVLNLDHYTLLRNAIFSVKGVPLLYTPILYYPTNREDRATGVLIPTYATSTLRGQVFHNAFFWAINRSQDATFRHDWYTNTGQGVGGEYRYSFGDASDGNFNVHWLNQRETKFLLEGGSTSTLPAQRSYEIRGGANQGISQRFRARADINYFSSIQAKQTTNTNIYDTSLNQRNFGGNVIGLARGFSINGTLTRSEYFSPGTNISTLNGSWPRVSVTRSESPLFGSAFYYSLGAEYVYLLRSQTTGAPTGSTALATVVDTSLGRLDFNPQIRYPFKKWQWFTVNSTIGWRDTSYTRSYDVTRNPLSHAILSQTLVDAGLNRRFFTFQSQLLGPLFSRVWNTPDSGYAEKFKHSIEPFLTVDRTTAIDNYDNIVKLDGIDYTLGETTRYTYGVNNRFYAKRRPPPDSPLLLAQAREILAVEFSQSYYSDARASLVDPSYSTSFGVLEKAKEPTKFSPMALSARTTPTDQLNVTMRAEIDSRYLALRTVSASGTYTMTNRLAATGSWTKSSLIPELPGFNNPASLTHYVNASTNVHTPDNRFGGIYSFNYDLQHSSMLQQRVTGFYNAQCCGLSFEYQIYNLGGISSLAVPADRRFFMSFSLAGLGNFSPFNGAMGGVPR